MIYRKDIDFYRAISVISVILFHHFDNIFINGYLGVDIFFVISGFLITSQIYSQLNNNNFSILSFYIRRVRRILPLLLFFILSTITLSIFLLLPNELLNTAESSIFSITFIPNFYFWKVINYFDPVSFNKLLLHLWSLGIEEQFYIVFPFFCLLMQKLIDKENIHLFSFFIIFCLSLILYITFYNEYPEEVFYFPITRAWELLTGSLVFFFIKRNTKINDICIAFLSIFIILILFSSIYTDTSFLRILICLSAGLILLKDNSKIFDKSIFKVFLLIGRISFGLYLWHYLFISLNDILELKINHIFIFFLYFFISIITYFVIEKPFRNKNIISNKILFYSLTSLSIVIIVLIIIIIINKGFINNFPEEKRNLLKIDNRESSQYVIQKFNQYEKKLFNKYTDKKILIIGDSYAQDFVNIFDDINKNNPENDIVTKYISVECANLFIENIKDIVADYCLNKNQFYDDDLINNISLSNYIFLANFWQKDKIEYLARSITNIKNITDAKIYIVGTKKFSKKSIRKMLNIPKENLNEYIEKPDDNIIEINNFLIKNFGDNYIDFISLYCEEKCKLFDNDKLLSYDGNHLTRYGVEYFSNKLRFDHRVNLKDN